MPQGHGVTTPRVSFGYSLRSLSSCSGEEAESRSGADSHYDDSTGGLASLRLSYGSEVFRLLVVVDRPQGNPEVDAVLEAIECCPDQHPDETQRCRWPEDVAKDGVDENGEDIPPPCFTPNSEDAAWIVKIPRPDPDV